MEKAMAPHSSTLAWKPHGRRSLVGCSPWGVFTLWLLVREPQAHLGKQGSPGLTAGCVVGARPQAGFVVGNTWQGRINKALTF